MPPDLSVGARPDYVAIQTVFPAMAVVNRSAVAVAPRQPLIDWSRRLSEGDDLAWTQEDHSLYLLPACDDPQQAWQQLERLHGRIFECELESWCPDRGQWPTPRDFALFCDWFSIRFYDLIDDLAETPLQREPQER